MLEGRLKHRGSGVIECFAHRAGEEANQAVAERTRQTNQDAQEAFRLLQDSEDCLPLCRHQCLKRHPPQICHSRFVLVFGAIYMIDVFYHFYFKLGEHMPYPGQPLQA
jgi:hypothetical protein